jgi:hypothetical protein
MPISSVWQKVQIAALHPATLLSYYGTPQKERTARFVVYNFNILKHHKGGNGYVQPNLKFYAIYSNTLAIERLQYEILFQYCKSVFKIAILRLSQTPFDNPAQKCKIHS